MDTCPSLLDVLDFLKMPEINKEEQPNLLEIPKFIRTELDASTATSEHFEIPQTETEVLSEAEKGSETETGSESGSESEKTSESEPETEASETGSESKTGSESEKASESESESTS